VVTRGVCENSKEILPILLSEVLLAVMIFVVLKFSSIKTTEGIHTHDAHSSRMFLTPNQQLVGYQEEHPAGEHPACNKFK